MNTTVETKNEDTATAVKAKTKGTGDLIFDISHELEGLSKTKALNLAEKLGEDIDTNFFRLGGVLHLIKSQQWYEGFPSFQAYVLERFGFAARKADYLEEIYVNLVKNQIPWEKVHKMGWTKLKDLAKYLTKDNLDEWVAKAEALTVLELQAAIKSTFQGGETNPDGSTSTTTNVQKVGPFKVHPDQYEQIVTALAKAKGEIGTDHDNVALAGICGGYLANASGVGGEQPESLDTLMARIGSTATAALIQASFPEVTVVVEDPSEAVMPLSSIKSMNLDAVFATFEKVFPKVNLDVNVNSTEPA